MNIRQLQALKAVIENHTTTRAAEKLNLTQPAVSGLIAGLERSLGIQLFERSKGRLLPTPEAHRLVHEANKVLTSFSRMEQRARRLSELKTGELQIVSLPGPALEFLPRIVAEFLTDKPDVRVSLQIRPSVEVQEWITAGYMDIGLAELPIDDQGLDYELITMRCVCVVPATHPLASRSVITPLDLDGVPFIALEPGHMTYSRLAAAFHNVGANFNVRINVQLFAPACVLVAKGAGVALVDPISAQVHSDRGLKAIRFEPAIPFTIGLLRQAGKPSSLLTQEFLQHLKREFAPYLINS